MFGITDMELVGNYAIKFSFSDGHDTGIYSWDRVTGREGCSRRLAVLLDLAAGTKAGSG